jgi:hypothetical protein
MPVLLGRFRKPRLASRSLAVRPVKDGTWMPLFDDAALELFPALGLAVSVRAGYLVFRAAHSGDRRRRDQAAFAAGDVGGVADTAAYSLTSRPGPVSGGSWPALFADCRGRVDRGEAAEAVHDADEVVARAELVVEAPAQRQAEARVRPVAERVVGDDALAAF